MVENIVASALNVIAAIVVAACIAILPNPCPENRKIKFSD